MSVLMTLWLSVTPLFFFSGICCSLCLLALSMFTHVTHSLTSSSFAFYMFIFKGQLAAVAPCFCHSWKDADWFLSAKTSKICLSMKLFNISGILVLKSLQSSCPARSQGLGLTSKLKSRAEFSITHSIVPATIVKSKRMGKKVVRTEGWLYNARRAPVAQLPGDLPTARIPPFLSGVAENGWAWLADQGQGSCAGKR